MPDEDWWPTDPEDTHRRDTNEPSGFSDRGVPSNYGELAGPGEDPAEPPEDPEGAIEEEQLREGMPAARWGSNRHAAMTATGAQWPHAPLPDPAYTAQETGQLYTPRVPEDGGSRPIDEASLADLQRWGRTVAYLIDTGVISEHALSDVDRRSLAAHRVAVNEAAESWADEVWARAIYKASLVEPYGDAVPTFDQLPDETRDIYRRQAHRAVALATQYLAAFARPV